MIAGPTLRELADKQGMWVGNVGYNNDPGVAALLAEQFNYLDVSWDTGWANLEPVQGQIRWSNPNTPPYFLGGDVTAAFARAHHMHTYGGLIYGAPRDYSAWLDTLNLSRDQAISLMDQHIQEVMTHFKGLVDVWSVVDEYGDWPDDPFRRLIGPDYIDLAFKEARQVANQIDPSIKLIYNDTGNESVPSDVWWGYNTQKTLGIVQRLKAAGLIDGVGIQGHYIAPYFPRKEDVVSTVREYEKLVPVYVTEYDDDIKDLQGSQQQRFALQAQYDSTMIGAFLTAGVKTITFYGAADKYSWEEVPGDEWIGSSWSPNANSTLFDDNLQPKPNYYAVRDLLQNPPQGAH
jgi:endo-1,4-beta-xylanase